MKLNLEVELEWINEEMGLDETIRQNIIDQIVNKISKNVQVKIEEKVNKIIDEVIVKKIDTMTEKIFNDFMDKEICITDGYGDKVKCYKNVYEVIKLRFDNFMNQKVDTNGKTTSSSYDTKFDRLTFIVDKQLKDFADKFTTDAVKKVSDEIKLTVKDGLTQKLGAELMNVLKVNEMLKIKN